MRSPVGGWGDLLRHPPMPAPVRVTVLLFGLLALLFALATVHRLVSDSGSIGAAAFFAVMAVASVGVAAALVTRRRWAAYPAFALSALLAVASLGMFGAITVVGIGLLAWVLVALNGTAARVWLSGRRRLR